MRFKCIRCEVIGFVFHEKVSIEFIPQTKIHFDITYITHLAKNKEGHL